MKTLLLLLLSFNAFAATCTTTVQPGGSIQVAVNSAVPGSTICVANGTYPGFYVSRSGSVGSYITVMALNQGQAKITSTIALNSASYITISGFDVTSPTWTGFYLGNCTTVAACGHHRRIVNNTVHDCAEAGIHVAHSDYSYIVGNTVYRNAFTNSDASSGISIWESVDSGSTDSNPWGNGFRNYIASNIVYANDNCVRNADDSYAQPLKCISSPTDGNGIIIDDNLNTQSSHIQGPYQGNFLVENNLVYDNGGAGVHSFYSANVTVRSNQVFWNHRRVGTSTWKGELSNVYSQNNQWLNNIGVANTCPANPNYNAANTPMLNVNSTGATWTGNVLSREVGCVK